MNERVGSGLAVAGGALLLAALFLPWYDADLSRFLVVFGATDRLPRRVDAWQAYSAADLLLVLVAVSAMVTGAAGATLSVPRLGWLSLLVSTVAGGLAILAEHGPPEVITLGGGPVVTYDVAYGRTFGFTALAAIGAGALLGALARR